MLVKDLEWTLVCSPKNIYGKLGPARKSKIKYLTISDLHYSIKLLNKKLLHF